MAEFVTAVTTCGTLEAAQALATAAIAQHLAACCQISGPLQSIYRWQGIIETATEWQAAFKTTRAALPALQELVLSRHPYDTPEFLVWEISSGSEKYLTWLRGEVVDSG
ncbi:MAG: divalent-cation tolerance protein CutA [Pirellulales bacterium]|nr:divalent-cation tolerance protein CutA [Pirellulales bacterium]